MSMPLTRLEDCRILDLPKIADDRGNLSFFEGGRHLPFAMRRVYWIYDVPGGESRGQHAYRNTEEFIVALSGSFEVCLDDGRGQRVFPLMRAYYGLHVPPMIWRRLQNFSTNSVALVAVSRPYDPAEYLRDYEQFRVLKGGPA